LLSVMSENRNEKTNAAGRTKCPFVGPLIAC